MSKLALRANRQLPALRLKKVDGETKTFADDDHDAKVHFVPGHWVGEALTEKGKEISVEGSTRKEVATVIRAKAGFRRRKEELLADLKAGNITEEQLVKKAKQINPDFKVEAPKPKAKAKAKPKAKKKSKDVDPLS